MAARTQRKTSPTSHGFNEAAHLTSTRPEDRTRQRQLCPALAARPSDKAREIYMVGLRDAHAVEMEAMQVMKRQVGAH